MKPVSWKVLFGSLAIVLPLFLLAAVVYSLVAIILRQLFGSTGLVGSTLDHASIVLAFSVAFGFKWSRGRSEIVAQPLVPWLVAVPMSLLLTATLVVLYQAAYVSALVMLKLGIAELQNLPRYLRLLLRTDDLRQIVIRSVAVEPVMAFAFLVTLLFAYYGPVSKELKDAVKDFFQN